MITLVCNQCGAEYERYPSEIASSKYCSRKCHNQVSLVKALESRRAKARRARCQEGGTIKRGVINLPRGASVLVDAEDIDLDAHFWNLDERTGYAKQGQTYMHRLILSRVLGRAMRPGELVDHANGDKLDNRRTNLRLATKANNNQNSRVRKDNRLGVKGVSCRGTKFRTRVGIATIGVFSTIEEAAYVYDQVALQLYGPYARTNFDLTY